MTILVLNDEFCESGTAEGGIEGGDPFADRRAAKSSAPSRASRVGIVVSQASSGANAGALRVGRGMPPQIVPILMLSARGREQFASQLEGRGQIYFPERPLDHVVLGDFLTLIAGNTGH